MNGRNFAELRVGLNLKGPTVECMWGGAGVEVERDVGLDSMAKHAHDGTGLWWGGAILARIPATLATRRALAV